MMIIDALCVITLAVVNANVLHSLLNGDVVDIKTGVAWVAIASACALFLLHGAQ